VQRKAKQLEAIFVYIKSDVCNTEKDGGFKHTPLRLYILF